MYILLLGFIFSQDTIYFIYNAKDDPLSVVGDVFHKSFSSKTYPCQLCKVTYGPFVKKKKWKEFLNSIEYKYEFIYRNNMDDFAKNINSFPIILFGAKEDFKILVSTEKLNSIERVDNLIREINNQLILNEK